MKKLVILRGCSGSGKSTVAKSLPSPKVICSADQYFLDSDGHYNFDPKQLHLAHTFCRGMCKGAMEAEANLVIIDNTNIQRRDYVVYITLAKQYGYDVEEVVVGEFDEASVETYAARNTHGVPKATIQKMAQRFER